MAAFPRSPMRIAPAVLACSILLTACTTGSSATQSTLHDQLKNPLYAELYYDMLVDQMVNLVIQNDPIAESEDMKKVIEKYRVEALRQAEKANELQAEGKSGQIVSDFGSARGEALLLGNTLYMGPEFNTAPGPDLHVYLSEALDPRDAAFPDPSATDIGQIGSFMGAHAYTLSLSDEAIQNVRLLVLYDRRLKRIYGFAQLQSRN